MRLIVDIDAEQVPTGLRCAGAPRSNWFHHPESYLRDWNAIGPARGYPTGPMGP
ncbi:hypothetical protein HNP40_003457 [Mycobacteroides chelonae]|nr:hypothetical protein [Mycobacteroides chelonae]